MFCFKMAAKNDFHFAKMSCNHNLKKKKKNNFPKEFFNEIWLKIGEYKFIYIFEIKFEKNYSVKKWWPKQVLSYCAMMLIYAN